MLFCILKFFNTRKSFKIHWIYLINLNFSYSLNTADLLQIFSSASFFSQLRRSQKKTVADKKIFSFYLKLTISLERLKSHLKYLVFSTVKQIGQFIEN